MGAADSPTHARDATTKPERVEYIASLMGELQWERGKTGRMLAKAWGISDSTVRDYAAEASRMVTADAEQARRDISVVCSKLLRTALTADNHKGARAVGELWAKVSGAMAPERHELVHEATPAAAAAAVREAFGGHAAAGNDEEAVPPADTSGDS